MRLSNSFVFVDGGLPIARFAQGAGFGFAGFGVGGVESEGAGAVRDRRFVFFELDIMSAGSPGSPGSPCVGMC